MIDIATTYRNAMLAAMAHSIVVGFMLVLRVIELSFDALERVVVQQMIDVVRSFIVGSALVD